MRRGSKKVQFRKGKGKTPPEDRALVRKDEVPTLLPMLQDQLATGITLRFITTSNWTGSYTVTWANLLDAWFVAGTANNAYQLFDFVRIVKVTVRAMGVADPASPLAPSSTCGVEFPGLIGGQFGGGKQKIANGIGTTVPALLSIRPDPRSQSAQFQPSTTNVAFVVRAVDGLRRLLEGVIIDIQVVYRNSADISPAAVTTARAGMTPGQIMFGGIDGLLPANTIAKTTFTPQG